MAASASRSSTQNPLLAHDVVGGPQDMPRSPLSAATNGAQASDEPSGEMVPSCNDWCTEQASHRRPLAEPERIILLARSGDLTVEGTPLQVIKLEQKQRNCQRRDFFFLQLHACYIE